MKLRRSFARRLVPPYQLAALAKASNLRVEELEAHLWRLYTNVMKQRDDGVVSCFPPKVLASFAGRCKAELEFIETLKKKRWIRRGALAFWPQVWGKALRRRYSRRRPVLQKIWRKHGLAYGGKQQTPSRQVADTLQTPSAANSSASLKFEIGPLPMPLGSENMRAAPNAGVYISPPKTSQLLSSERGEKTRKGEILFPGFEKNSDVSLAAAGGPGGKKIRDMKSLVDVPSEIRGLTLFERDSILCRQFDELRKLWGTFHLSLDVPAQLKKAHEKAYAMHLSGERIKKPVPWLTSWMQHAADDLKNEKDPSNRGRNSKQTWIAESNRADGTFKRWS